MKNKPLPIIFLMTNNMEINDMKKTLLLLVFLAISGCANNNANYQVPSLPETSTPASGNGTTQVFGR